MMKNQVYCTHPTDWTRLRLTVVLQLVCLHPYYQQYYLGSRIPVAVVMVGCGKCTMQPLTVSERCTTLRSFTKDQPLPKTRSCFFCACFKLQQAFELRNTFENVLNFRIESGSSMPERRSGLAVQETILIMHWLHCLYSFAPCGIFACLSDS